MTTTAARPHPNIETAFVGNEAVLLNVDSGEVFALNPSASAVWLLLDGELPATAIADDLADIVGLPRSALLPDVEAAIDRFAQQGLLEPPAPLDDPVHGPIPLYPPPDT